MVACGTRLIVTVVILVFLYSWTSSTCALGSEPVKRRPNIVLIMADVTEASSLLRAIPKNRWSDRTLADALGPRLGSSLDTILIHSFLPVRGGL
jgi:hypothetical protein